MAAPMSIFGAGGAPDYDASKGAVVQLTRALAVEWARDNIQVNAILPGWLASDMGDRAKARPGFEETVVKRIPAHRWGDPGDLAGAAVFLSSAASNFVTGIALPVDGGYPIKGEGEPA